MDDKVSLVSGPPNPGPFKSCLDSFEQIVANHPDDVALVACHQQASLYGYKDKPLDTQEYSKSPYLRWTFRTLRLAIDQLARSLKDRGVVPGTPIFTFLPNGAEFTTTFWASDLLGGSLVPINIRNLANEQEVAHMIKTALSGCPQAAKSVVITDSAETATKLDTFDAFSQSLKVICGNKDWQQWTAFEPLVAMSKNQGSFIQRSASLGEAYWTNIILFTSGTTNLPKGVKWGGIDLCSFLAGRKAAGPEWQVGRGDVYASLAPNNHAMGCFIGLLTLCNGGTMLYPGPYFEPISFLDAARQERCTAFIAVPTMVYALLLAKTDQAIKLEYLRTVLLGGAPATPEVLRVCVDELGAQEVENTYGMTEGLYCMTGSQQVDVICRGNDVSIGRPGPGSSWKICAPGSREPLPRLEVGELHGSFPHLHSPYIGKETEDFYISDRPWFRTGDSAYIDEEGRLFIVGRFKEMIIRGGENVSPAAIEAVINEQADLRPLQIQIVAAPDQIAGEVPVGIVAKRIDTERTKVVKDLVIGRMGKMYSIDDIVCLEDLGLDDFPRTMAGKVRKTELTERMRRYKQQEELSNGVRNVNGNANSKLTDEILEIWARVAGFRVSDLKLNTELDALGDSITLMRVKDRMYKQTGINLTVREILESGSLGSMIQLAQKRAVDRVVPDNTQFLPADRPPTEEDMVHTVDDDEMFETTKAVVEDAIKPHGLTWDNVRDVMPAYDFTEVASKNGILEHWSFKIALLLKNVDTKGARKAWKKAMANNPMQSSFITWDERLGGDLTLQITVDQNDRFLDSLIEDRGTLATVADLKQTAFDMVMFQGANYPGPMHRLYIYHIEETKCAGIIYNMHHAVTDASFGQLVMEDLDLALTGATLKPHVPYKLYCDNFYNLRTSPPARAGVKYHAQKLKDLAKHKAHIFPPLNRPLQIEDGKQDGCIRAWPAANMQNLLKKRKDLAPSLVLKAAYALFLLNVTDHTHAIFSQVEGARDKFPFMSNAVAEASKLEASDVGGQLYQSVLNMISLQPGETTIAFLTRLQEDAVLQTKHASAPWKEIMRSIGGEGGELFETVCTHCIFNWLGTDMSPGSRFQQIELVNAPIRRDVAKLVVNGGWLREPGGDKIQIHLRGSVWSIPDLDKFTKQIEAVAEWVTDEKNWDRPVAEFKESMTSLNANGVH